LCDGVEGPFQPTGAQTVSYSLGAAGSAGDRLDQYASTTVQGQAAQTLAHDANGNRSQLGALITDHDAENRGGLENLHRALSGVSA
jgi:hypothetical protein